MGTIQASGVSDRIEAGDSVIGAAKSAGTRPVKSRLLVFVRVHRGFAAAQKQVDRIEIKLHDIHDRIGSLDVVQDAAVEKLVAALIGDGLPRANPFGPFRALSPSRLVRLGDVAEAKAVISLVRNVRQRKNLSRGTLAALKDLEKAAKAVLQAAKPIEALQRALGNAIKDRGGLAQGWSNAFAALKHAAIAAEDDGAKGLYDTLFVRVTPTPKKRGAKKAAAVVGPAG